MLQFGLVKWVGEVVSKKGLVSLHKIYLNIFLLLVEEARFLKRLILILFSQN